MRVLLHAFGFVREAPRLYAVGFFRTERASLAFAGSEADARAAFDRAGTGHSLDERMSDGTPRFRFEEDQSVTLVAQGGGRWSVHVGGSVVGCVEEPIPMGGPRWGGRTRELLEGAGVKLVDWPR